MKKCLALCILSNPICLPNFSPSYLFSAPLIPTFHAPKFQSHTSFDIYALTVSYHISHTQRAMGGH